MRGHVGAEVVDRHAAPFRARLRDFLAEAHSTQLRHDQIVEIGAGALRREPDDGAAGAAPALGADSCGELSGAVDVVVDQDDQPLDAGEDGERAEFAAGQCGPGRLQRRAAVGNPGGGGEHGLDAFADDQRLAAGHSFTAPARPSMRRSTCRRRGPRG